MSGMGNGTAAPTQGDDPEKTPPASPTFSAPKRKRPGFENPINPTQLSDSSPSQKSNEDHPLTQKDPESKEESEAATAKELTKKFKGAVNSVKEVLNEIIDSQNLGERKTALHIALTEEIAVLNSYAVFKLASELTFK